MASEESPNNFTPAQEKALADAWTLLGEHFDTVLLCIETEHETEHVNVSTTFWRGSLMAAIGLATDGQFKLLHRKAVRLDPPTGDEV